MQRDFDEPDGLIESRRMHRDTVSGPKLAALIMIVATVGVLGFGLGAVIAPAFSATPPPVFTPNTSLLKPSDFGAGAEFVCAADGVKSGYGGFVSATNSHAARVGLEVLSKGGSAADAAVAVQFALGFAQPQSTGIGGGFFGLHFNAGSGDITFIDAREEAPAYAHPRMFCLNESCITDADCVCGGAMAYKDAQLGGMSVGVPGTVAGMQLLHETGGKLPWKDCVGPASALARKGMRVPDHFSRVIQRALDDGKLTSKTAQALFVKDGVALAEGADFRNERLADTYDKIAANPKAFYTTLRATWMAEVNAAAPPAFPKRFGRMVDSDVEGYRAILRAPAHANLRFPGVNVSYYSANFPSAGGHQVGMTAGLLSGDVVSGILPASAASAHHILDAQALAYADRQQWFGDADFSDIPSGFLSEEYWAERRAMFNGWMAVPTPVKAGRPGGTQPKASPAASQPEHGTTHFVVGDAQGNVASVTTTIESNFGSGLVSELGFILNNELTDFDLEAPEPGEPVRPNSAEGRRAERRTALGEYAKTIGGKRPRSTMSPTIAIIDRAGRIKSNGQRAVTRELAALGSPGGATIASTVSTVLLRLVMGATLSEAVAGPRVLSTNQPGQIAHVESWAADGPFAAELVRRNFSINARSYLGYCEGAVMRLKAGSFDRLTSHPVLVVADSRIPTAGAEVQNATTVSKRDCVSVSTYDVWEADLDYA